MIARVGLLALALLCGCGRRHETDAPRLRYTCYFEVPTFDPYEAWKINVSQVSQNIFAPLVSSYMDSKPQGLVAEDWRVDATGRVWRFKIRPGLRFGDGHPVTPEAVLRNFRRMLWLTRGEGLQINNLLPELSRWKRYEDPLRSVRAEGDSLVFEFCRRPVNLLETLSMPAYGIADPECFDPRGRWKDPFCASGSGQYRVVEAAPGRIVLRSRHLFPEAELAPEEVEIRPVVGSGNDYIEEMRQGRGDLAFAMRDRIGLTEREELRRHGLLTTEGPRVGISLVQMNSDRPVFRDKALRQSVRDVFLRELLSDPLFTSQDEVDASFLPKGAVGYLSIPIPDRHSLRKARGSTVRIRLIGPREGSPQSAAKAALAKALQAHGLRPDFTPLPEDPDPRGYDIMRWTYGIFVNDPYADLRRLFMSGKGMYLPIRSPELARLILRGEASADAAERQRLAQRVNAWLFEDARLVAYSGTSVLFLHRPGVDLSRVNLFLDPIEFRAVGWRPAAGR